MRNNKEYYTVAGVEAEDVIDGMDMWHREGAPTKYLFRNNNIFPKGDKNEDLKKALHYLHNCIKNVSKIPRDNNSLYFITRIDSSVFNDNIYFAISEMLYAIGKPESEYIDSINKVIKYIEAELYD